MSNSDAAMPWVDWLKSSARMMVFHDVVVMHHDYRLRRHTLG